MTGENGAGQRVILVDDSADEAEFVRRALRASHLDVELHVYRSGADALERALGEAAGGRGAPASLVLLDLKLPGLDGHAILAAIRRTYSLGELPVVVFTSSREPSDVSRACEAGANGYVVKPLAFERYAETVGAVARYWLDANVQVEAKERSGA